MKIGFVIGNGKSRLKFGLSDLVEKGTVYGCNYAARDIPVHNAIIVDRHVLFDILSQPHNDATIFWSRKKWANNLKHEKPIYALPEQLYKTTIKWDFEQHWGSGPHAVWKASEENDIVVMIGFDLWNDHKTNNNVYAGKHGYGNNPVDPRAWIYQLEQTFKRHPDKSFVQIQPDGWTIPDSWKGLENFSMDNFKGLSDFLKSN